jgi:hypothetical protein
MVTLIERIASMSFHSCEPYSVARHRLHDRRPPGSTSSARDSSIYAPDSLTVTHRVETTDPHLAPIRFEQSGQDAHGRGLPRVAITGARWTITARLCPGNLLKPGGLADGADRQIFLWRSVGATECGC